MAPASLLLNSAREIKLEFSKRLVRAAVADVIASGRSRQKKRVPDAIETTPLCELPNHANSFSIPSVAEGH
jgi:hypothetical protein